MSSSKLVIPYRPSDQDESAIIFKLAVTNVFCNALKISKTTLTSEAALEYFLSYVFFHYSADDKIEERAKAWMKMTLRPELIKGKEKLLEALYMTPIQGLFVEDWALFVRIIQNLGDLPVDKLTGKGREQFDILNKAVEEARPSNVSKDDWMITPNDVVVSLLTLYLHADESGKNILWTNYWIDLVGYIHPKIQALNAKLKNDFKYVDDQILLLVLDQLRIV